MGSNSKKATRVRVSVEGFAPVILRSFGSDMISLDWPNENSFTEDSQGNTTTDIHPGIDNCDITIPMAPTTPATTLKTLRLMYDAWATGIPVKVEVEQGGSLGFTHSSMKSSFANPPRPDGVGKDGGGIWTFKMRADNLKPKNINTVGRAVDQLASIVNI